MTDRGYSAEYAATFAEGKAVDMRGKTMHGTYLVGKMLPNSSRAINLILADKGATTYLSYTIGGNTLKIAGACREISEESHCKTVSGNSDSSRAIDFNTSKTITAVRI